VQLLQGGAVDIAQYLQPLEIISLRTAPNVVVETVPASFMIWIELNAKIPPFDKVDVRRAMNFAFPRDEVMESIYQGLASPHSGCMPNIYPGYKEIAPYSYDLTKAKELLEKAGGSRASSTSSRPIRRCSCGPPPTTRSSRRHTRSGSPRRAGAPGWRSLSRCILTGRTRWAWRSIIPATSGSGRRSCARGSISSGALVPRVEQARARLANEPATAQAGDCPAAIRLGLEVRDVDRAYYDQTFVRDPAIGGCTGGRPSSEPPIAATERQGFVFGTGLAFGGRGSGPAFRKRGIAQVELRVGWMVRPQLAMFATALGAVLLPDGDWYRLVGVGARAGTERLFVDWRAGALSMPSGSDLDYPTGTAGRKRPCGSRNCGY
jgi:hypothetical protein